eukprot:TRINITY_DN1469_c0_g1_i1.p1 TRINITY_DN1469_c0_g1~~TRINITY_DN1469_c0_g1_i1.p1  ORF type:complete len:246 (+),score=43.52 TRINITY_DN1469_c0_g1_i1:204-941(+)
MKQSSHSGGHSNTQKKAKKVTIATLPKSCDVCKEDNKKELKVPSKPRVVHSPSPCVEVDQVHGFTVDDRLSFIPTGSVCKCGQNGVCNCVTYYYEDFKTPSEYALPHTSEEPEFIRVSIPTVLIPKKPTKLSYHEDSINKYSVPHSHYQRQSTMSSESMGLRDALGENEKAYFDIVTSFSSPLPSPPSYKNSNRYFAQDKDSSHYLHTSELINNQSSFRYGLQKINQEKKTKKVFHQHDSPYPNL